MRSCTAKVRLMLVAFAGSEYDEDGMITTSAYKEHAMRWTGMGAEIVGGCCGVGPGHMGAIVRHLAAAAVARCQEEAL
jgi:S-methylmethionine-dependent homocysteine/selenocysteine methylase